MGVDSILIGQVISKVGDHLSIRIRGMVYNTRLNNILKIGDKVQATFKGGTRSIIAVQRIEVCENMSADDISDDFMTCKCEINYCEIEWSEYETNDCEKELICSILYTME